MIIDTHILIWLLNDNLERLGREALEIAKTQSITVSTASLFEIAMKKRKDKLDAPDTESIYKTLEQQGITVLDIAAQHIYKVPGLAATPHADPFDLLLMSQAISEDLPFLTCDAEILKTVCPGLRLIDGRL
ncbi:MAG TPA: type II toxin-antitoxin system VapC family toxin [Candidatus Saccharimonadales bacterium]